VRVVLDGYVRVSHVGCHPVPDGGEEPRRPGRHLHQQGRHQDTWIAVLMKVAAIVVGAFFIGLVLALLW
jgi:hypothetical protein